MKKITLMALAAMFSAGVFAQTTTSQQADKKQAMKDVRKDTRDIRRDKKLKNYELNHHDKVEAKAEKKDIKADKTERKNDVKDLKYDGVKHPMVRADRQIKRQNHRH